jgi:hypothetical protein
MLNMLKVVTVQSAIMPQTMNSVTHTDEWTEGDDGSVCIHPGAYIVGEAGNGTAWCQTATPADEGVLTRIPAGVRLNHTTNTKVRCSFSGRNSQSRMLLDRTIARI